MRVRTETEMLDSFTRVLGATEKEGVGASRGPQGNLVDGESLATSLLDASTGRGGESKSGNRELGEFWELLAPGLTP